MASRKPDSRNRGGRPKTGIGKALGLRLYPEESAIVAEFQSEADEEVSSHEAIRAMIRYWKAQYRPKRRKKRR